MTRRGPNEGSIYQRESDGKWVGMLSLGFDGSGKRRRKPFYGGTQREVRVLLERAKVDIEKGLPVPSSEPTVAELLEDWFRHGVEVKDWTPATAQGYRSIIDTHLLPALGRHRLRKLTPRHVQSLLNELTARGRDPQTVKNVRAALRSALSLAMKRELVSRNVATLTDAPRVERSEITPLNPDEARTFLAAVSGHRLSPLFTVATALGLRQSEVVGLAWNAVDLDGLYLEVRQRTYRKGGEWHTGRTKSGRARTIPFPVEIATVLRQQRTAQLEDRLRAGSAWEDSGLVFTNTTGGALYGPYVTRTMQRLMREAGLQRKRFHDLRHTAATLMLVMGVPLETIQETLGHASFRTTKDIYAHVLPSMQREAADKMGAFLRGEA